MSDAGKNVNRDTGSLRAVSKLPYRPGDMIAEKYQLLSLIGKGGMGAIYVARHKTIDQALAIKLHLSDRVDDTAWKRFEREGQLLARLNHPGIVKILEIGKNGDGNPYYVMELLEGTTLAERLNRNSILSQEEIVHIFPLILETLGFVHQNSVVHRDVKPTNIMLVRPPKDIDVRKPIVKLLDFGMARSGALKSHSQALTHNDEIVGSPLYMSPEQAEGKPVDHRSDLYSLACTLYECVCGAPPFRGNTSLDTLLLHQTKAPERVRRADFSAQQLEAINNFFDRALQKKPDDRFQSAQEMCESLLSCGFKAFALDDMPQRTTGTIDLKSLAGRTTENTAADKNAPESNESIIQKGAQIGVKNETQETTVSTPMLIFIAAAFIVLGCLTLAIYFILR